MSKRIKKPRGCTPPEIEPGKARFKVHAVTEPATPMIPIDRVDPHREKGSSPPRARAIYSSRAVINFAARALPGANVELEIHHSSSCYMARAPASSISL